MAAAWVTDELTVKVWIVPGRIGVPVASAASTVELPNSMNAMALAASDVTITVWLTDPLASATLAVEPDTVLLTVPADAGENGSVFMPMI